MSTITIKLIEAQSLKLKREGRKLRNWADVCPNETRAMVLRRQAWRFMAASRRLMEQLGEF